MNVTYLIGNGFDLGMGLHTDFKSFLKYYAYEIPSPTQNIDYLKKAIKQDTIELWADFEKCFGEYIANFNEETIDNYVEVYENVLSELNNYLNTENDRFSDDISKEEQQIIKWICLTELNNIGFRPAIINDLYYYTKDENHNFTREDIVYNFLSFNYTDTLDRILDQICDPINGFLYHDNEDPFNRIIAEPIHVHGKLNENMIIGVNDQEQLPFSGILPDRVKRRIIKPEKNKKIGYRINETATTLINNSDIICIYGMSIGETDAIWWEIIGKWLLTEYKKKLIYFVYDKNINVNKKTIFSMDQLLDAEDMYCEKLLNSLKVPKEKFEYAKECISVVINSKFMQINKAKELSTNQERNL